MRNNIVTVVVLVSMIAILSLLAFFVRIGATADSIAVLKTTGMTCGSCSRTITKVLETVKGVAVAEVDVEGGWVVVGYETRSVKPETLAARVSSTGFVSTVNMVLTPEQFKQITGRDIGAKAASGSGCCGGRGGRCGANKKS